VQESTTETVSNVIVNDAEEFPIVIRGTQGCAHRPSPRKRAQRHDQYHDRMPPKKRVCCTLCACVTLQKQAEGQQPREPD
jgi:hypothetical protein